MVEALWLVDSSGWIEYFTDGPNANAFAAQIEQPSALVVPSISLLEVYRWMVRCHGEGPAIQAIALMRQGQEIPLDTALALQAAQVGLEWKLPLADSIILATALVHKATLLTQDADFEGISTVQYIPKQS
ncbi:MAG: type II toxin-antitoxin system VapC family toxin [Cyanobium sp.]